MKEQDNYVQVGVYVIRGTADTEDLAMPMYTIVTDKGGYEKMEKQLRQDLVRVLLVRYKKSVLATLAETSPKETEMGDKNFVQIATAFTRNRAGTEKAYPLFVQAAPRAGSSCCVGARPARRPAASGEKGDSNSVTCHPVNL